MSLLHYTIGLEANGPSTENLGELVKVGFYETDSGEIRLQVESGHDLSRMPGTAIISATEYRNRPSEDVPEARWALDLCGWTLMIDDEQSEE